MSDMISCPSGAPSIAGIARLEPVRHRLKPWHVTLPIAALTLVLLASMALSGSAEEGPGQPTPAGPFDIAPEYDVTAGDGTAGNPYIIENRVIYVSSGGIGIDIRNSKAYYIIRNVTIIGTQSSDYGIFLSATSNVSVDGLTLRTLTIPLYTTGCERMRFQNVTVDDCFQGVQLWSTVSCTFVNMSLTSIAGIGMVATGCSYLSLEGCSARNTTNGGFEFIARPPRNPDCRNISLVGCAASDAGMGLAFSGADGCTIDGCNLTGGWPADVYLSDTRNLTMLDTDLGKGGLMIELAWMDLDIRDSNTVDGRPLRFIKGGDRMVVNSDVGQVVLVDCQDAIVENLTFQGIASPVMLLGSSDCIVRNCTCMDAYIAVFVAEGGPNRLEGITITEGGYPYTAFGINVEHGEVAIDDLSVTGVEVGVHALEGLRLGISNSSFVDVRSCGVLAEAAQPQSAGMPKRDLTVSQSRFHGIDQGIQATNWNLIVRDCRIEEGSSGGISAASTSSTAASGSKVSVERTEVVDCGYTGALLDGIEGKLSSLSVRGCTRGIVLGSRVLCTVTRCNISECDTGLVISSAYQLTVSECTIRDCANYGISISACYKAKLFHNNLIRNYYDEGSGRYTNPQAYDTSSDSEWDDGAMGNYWADYRQRYPSATATGLIWDTPYVISGYTARQDGYPLTLQYDYSPPVAEAGPERNVGENQTVWFDGSGCSDDVGIVNYTWEFVYEGHPISLYGLAPSFRFSGFASYTVTLWVIDGWGNTASDTTVVHVVDLVPPVAIAGDDMTVDAGTTFTLDGSRSTDDHGIIGYTWTVDPGGLDIVLHGASVTLSIGVPGNFAAVLSVSDARGNQATDTLVVRVRDLSPPIAIAGDDITVPQGSEVAFDATASTDNVGIVAWAWTFTYAGKAHRLDGVTSTFVFDDPGDYVIGLSAWDAVGNVGHDEVVVHVLDTVAPVAVAGGDLTVDQGTMVTISALGSHDNVGVDSYRWSFVEDGVPLTYTGPELERIFGVAGVFEVVLEVWDAAGNSGTCTVILTVRDIMPPVADAGPDLIVNQHDAVVLDGSGSIDSVGIVSYMWAFTAGDVNVTLEGRRPAATFDLAGIYLVTLTVADAAGNTAMDTLNVTVRDTEPPVAVAGSDRTVIEGDDLFLDATASHDNVGVISYVWTVVGEAGTETLTGPVVAVPTTKAGTLRVELRVNDAAGNTADDVLDVNVLPLNVSWRLGPFMDEDGHLLQGVKVSVTLNGTARTGITDGTGWLNLSIVRFNLVSPAHVNASKQGYDTVRFTESLDADGQPIDPVPRMRKVQDSSGTWDMWTWYVLIAVVGIVLVAVAEQRRRERSRRGT
jgi:PKD repeat protein